MPGGDDVVGGIKCSVILPGCGGWLEGYYLRSMLQSINCSSGLSSSLLIQV